MASWAYMLGGLLVWAAHFMGVYAIASIADVVVRDADAALARLAVGGLTLVCAAANAVLLAFALRRARRHTDELDRFIDSAAALATGLSLAAVIWQGLPALVGD